MTGPGAPAPQGQTGPQGPSIAAFTDRGLALAERLAAALGGRARRVGGAGPDGQPREGLGEWTRRAWEAGGPLVFVGAVGIAVRAVAPLLAGKESDPAVVAVDEQGRFAVAVAGGHLGGANDLARAAAAACGAEPVVTTATDLRGAFAVDEWAHRHGCAVADPRLIKAVSSKVLAGREVRVACEEPVAGEPPEGVRCVPWGEPCDVAVGVHALPGAGEAPGPLRVVPRAAVLGVGCRKGVAPEALEERLAQALAASRVLPQALALACTIDLKAGEEGLLAFCAARGLELRTFSAAELAAVPGEFSSSAFVLRAVGVDGVCERAAVLGSGGGRLALGKTAGGGAAMALALRPAGLDWR